MRIEGVASSGNSELAGLRERNRELQSVFNEVLAAAGREGYASAVPGDADQPLTQRISESWSNWFDTELPGGRYRGEPDGAALKQSYGDILLRASESAAYIDPKGFLRNLSSDELAVVQRIHGLAQTISVEGLSDEGAINLLIPPPAQVDLDRDGLTRVGAGSMLRFPDSTTPAEVVAAWEEATQGMSFRELATYQFQMKLPLLTANLVIDANGSFVARYEPGDPRFTNPMAAADYSYVRATQDWLDYLDAQKTQLPPDRYVRDRSFWLRFQQQLIEHSAA